MKRASCLLLMVAALTGCASGGTGTSWLGTQVSPPPPCAPLTSDQELTLNLSREMLEGGRLHAALANLERLPETLPEVRLRKARILRLLGRSEAQGLYRSLLNTCLSAEGRHGLGQLAAAGQHYEVALEHLRAAVELAPTEHAMRNDLGVVYLNLLRMREARFELMTAMELNEQESRAAENLLSVLIYEGQWAQASRLVTRYKLTPAQFQKAEQRAELLQRKQVTEQTVSGAPSGEVGQRAAAPVPAPARASTLPTAVSVPVPASVPAPASLVAPVVASAAVAAPASADVPAVGRVPALSPQVKRGGVQRVESSGSRPVVPITGVEDQGIGAR